MTAGKNRWRLTQSNAGWFPGSQGHETVKYGHETHMTENQECNGEDQQQFTGPGK
jgi:hypothetical protein